MWWCRDIPLAQNTAWQNTNRKIFGGTQGPGKQVVAQHPTWDLLVDMVTTILWKYKKAYLEIYHFAFGLDTGFAKTSLISEWSIKHDFMSPLCDHLSRRQTFVNKHQNLSKEVGSKIPAVEVEQDLQWCGRQLRCVVKVISKTCKW